MGFNVKKDVPPMERELIYLLGDLCVKWGFCIPADDYNQISKADYYQADEFGKDVVKAEGMDPDFETQWVQKIADRFKERFGHHEIKVSSFKDRVRGQEENW